MTLFWLLDIALRALSIALLARIGVSDFYTRRIANIRLLQLLALALAIQVLDSAIARSFQGSVMAIAIGAALFAALFAFWLAGKLGAGDVKLLAIVPMLVGVHGMFAFMFVFMLASYATYFVMKFPTILPDRWFRAQVEEIARMGRVPFGVPIAAAASVATLWAAGSLL